MLTSTTNSLLATTLPVNAIVPIPTPITTVPILGTTTVNTMNFNQPLTNTGFCAPNLGSFNNTPGCTTPNCFNGLGYNTTGVMGQQTNCGNCCGPNVNTMNPQYQQNYGLGCCGPANQTGITGGYNTSGFCGPSFGGSSNCCTPTIQPNGVITPGLCENSCGPAVLVPGSFSPGLCSNLCGPSVVGGNITDCCSPTIARPVAYVPNPNTHCEPIFNCCGPQVPPPQFVNPLQLPNAGNIPLNYNDNASGFFCGPTGICNCCQPDLSSAFLIHNKPKVRGGVVSKELTFVDEVKIDQTITPQSIITPVTAQFRQQAYNTTPGFVQTSPVGVPQINLTPTQKLSPQCIAILHAISSQLPISNLGIQFEAPVYLSQKQGIYVGQWVNDSMTGYGKLYFDNGGYFEGQFINGIATTNNGCFIYPDGSYYIGAVSNNYANGQGTYTYKNDTLVYKGNFVNDQPEGRGIEYYADQSRYEGDFRFGRKEGRGTFFWRDGTVYTGQFEGGFMQGYGVHHLSNGEVYEGEFRKNRRHGVGKLVNSLGTYQGSFRNDTKDGEGKFQWNDGRSFQGTFRDGKPDGPGMLILTNGKSLNGVWVNGVLDKDSLDTQSFAASQIGSLGAIGGTSLFHNGGSEFQNQTRGSLVLQDNMLQSIDVRRIDSSNLINNPFPAINQNLPTPFANIPTPVYNMTSSVTNDTPAVTPLFGSRRANANSLPFSTGITQPSGSVLPSSGINVGPAQNISSINRIIASPVGAFSNQLNSRVGISSNISSSGNVMGVGNAGVSPLSGVAANQTQAILGASPQVFGGIPQISTPIPVPGIVSTPNTPGGLPVSALNPSLTAPTITNSFNQNTSPFLGGSLNGSIVPSASITPGIGPIRGSNTGFGLIATTNTTTYGINQINGINDIRSTTGIGNIPTVATGGPIMPPSFNAMNNVGVGINGMNSFGGGIGTGVGINPSIPNQALGGVQTNAFSPPGFQRTPPVINQLSPVTPVGSYGAAPVGIPFVQPTGVPPVAIPRPI